MNFSGVVYKGGGTVWKWEWYRSSSSSSSAGITGVWQKAAALSFTTWPNGLYKSRTFAKYCFLEARWEHKLICTGGAGKHPVSCISKPTILLLSIFFWVVVVVVVFFSFSLSLSLLLSLSFSLSLPFQLNLVIATIKFDWIFLLCHTVLSLVFLSHLSILHSSTGCLYGLMWIYLCLPWPVAAALVVVRRSISPWTFHEGDWLLGEGVWNRRRDCEM